LPSFICHPPSAIRHLSFAIRHPPSAIKDPARGQRLTAESKVVSESGKPVAGAAVGWVELILPERRPGQIFKLDAMTAADADGQFRLGPLPAGKFQIKAVAESPRRLGKTAATVNGTTVITVRPE